MNLSSRLSRVLALEPGATALEFEGRAYPWSYLQAVRLGIVGELESCGLGPGTRCAVILRNRPQHVATVTALLASGHCIATINPFSSGAKVAADIDTAAAPVLIADEQDWAVPEIRAIARERGMATLCVRDDLRVPLQPIAGLEAVAGADLRADAPGIAIEMLTSGTTGEPKRVALSYQALEAAVVGGLKPEVVAGKLQLKSGPTIVYAPLVHIGGIFGIVLAFYEPRPVALLEKFDVPKWIALVRRYRPKFAGLVPAAIRMILDAHVPAEDLRSLLAVRAGTAPLDNSTREAFEARYDVPVLVTYGATEFAGAVTRWTLDEYRRLHDAKRGSVGRASPGFHLRIIDRDTGAELPIGDIGVLEVRAPGLFGERWTRTTDLASLDEDGYLFIHGRADAAINRGGFKVLPELVASVFREHPGIQDAVVVALPDSKLGHVPALAVEARPGTPRVTVEELRDFAREKLVSYQIPVRYLIVDSLPRTAAMKVRLVEVADLFNATT